MEARTSGSQPGSAEDKSFPKARYKLKYNDGGEYLISEEQTGGRAEPDVIVVGQNLYWDRRGQDQFCPLTHGKSRNISSLKENFPKEGLQDSLTLRSYNKLNNKDYYRHKKINYYTCGLANAKQQI